MLLSLLLLLLLLLLLYMRGNSRPPWSSAWVRTTVAWLGACSKLFFSVLFFILRGIYPIQDPVGDRASDPVLKKDGWGVQGLHDLYSDPSNREMYIILKKFMLMHRDKPRREIKIKQKICT